jgi:hypothetical protein
VLIVGFFGFLGILFAIPLHLFLVTFSATISSAFPHSLMKKLSLLLSTLGGAVAGYVFSNSKLRTELGKAKDAKAAGSILAKHLKEDGEKIGKEVKDFVNSQEVQDQWVKAKKYVSEQTKTLQKELKAMVTDSKKKAGIKEQAEPKKAPAKKRR